MFAPATTMDVVSDEMLYQSTDPRLVKKYGEREEAPRKAEPPKAPEKTEPPRREKPEKEERKQKRKSGPSVWDGVFGFLLKLLDFILKAMGKILSFLVFKPGKKYFRWMMKKKSRRLKVYGSNRLAWFPRTLKHLLRKMFWKRALKSTRQIAWIAILRRNLHLQDTAFQGS